MELLYFGYMHYIRSIDSDLGDEGLGRAHHRALYFISRRPGLTVSDLLSLLSITKQSLGRALGDLTGRGLIEARTGDRDRRQRLLWLTPAGKALENKLFEAGRECMAHAYAQAGQHAVSGFWAVLEGLIPDGDLPQVEQLRG